jgi:pilus assembly protein CpaB
MNRRFIIMLGVALLLGLLAAWIANRWIQSRVVANQAVSVVVAAVEIPYGVKLEASQVKVIAWPGNLAPQGAYSSKEQVIGRITMNKFYPDEIITEKRIAEHLGGSALSALIAKDYRAISVRVDDVVGVSGFILPGNKVDILVTKKDRSKNQAITCTLLQNINVLAVDQESSPEKEKPAIVKAVTLELKPEEANKIVNARQEGTIQLTLRNPLDKSSEETCEETSVEVAEVQPMKVVKTPVKKRVRKIIPW